MANRPISLHLHTIIASFGPAGAIELSDEQVASFGQGKIPPVTVRVGERSVAARVARMAGRNLVGLSKAARAALGVEIGESVDADIELDVSPRTVDIPPPLASALAADSAAQTAFDALSHTHRAEFARWVAEAKQDSTRERRVLQTIAMVREGRHR